jgi:hypothetical protein
MSHTGFELFLSCDILHKSHTCLATMSSIRNIVLSLAMRIIHIEMQSWQETHGMTAGTNGLSQYGFRAREYRAQTAHNFFPLTLMRIYLGKDDA